LELACNIFITSSFLLWTPSISLPIWTWETIIIRLPRNAITVSRERHLEQESSCLRIPNHFYSFPKKPSISFLKPCLWTHRFNAFTYFWNATSIDLLVRKFNLRISKGYA